MYKISLLTGRNKGGCLRNGYAYKWCITVDDDPVYNGMIFGYLEDFYLARKWCENTWGPSLEYDLWVNCNFADSEVPVNPHWTYDFSMDKWRLKIFLKTDSELNLFRTNFICV